jgi:hypothetical protein
VPASLPRGKDLHPVENKQDLWRTNWRSDRFVFQYCCLSLNTTVCLSILLFASQYYCLSLNTTVCLSILLFVCQNYFFSPVSTNSPLSHTHLYTKTTLFRRTGGISFPNSGNINLEKFLHCFSSVKDSEILLSTSEDKTVTSRRNGKSY